jgi:hypothetical protein
MEVEMKSKVILLLTILAIILSSCSTETADELYDEHIEKTDEVKVNINENFNVYLEKILNEIKIESGIENLELADIERIQDTYYVVVRLMNDEGYIEYYMLWKYNDSAQMLLKGKNIEILSWDNYYYVNYSGDFDGYRIIKYAHNDNSYEKLIYEGRTLNFSFSPEHEYMCIQDDNEIIVLDKNYEILFKNKLYNNAANEDEFGGVEIKFLSWSSNNSKLWVATGLHAYVTTFHLIDLEKLTLNTFHSGESYEINEIALNPDNNCIAYSTYPAFYESGAYDEFHSNRIIVYLYVRNLFTGEKTEVSSQEARGYRPKWINNKELEYNDPNGYLRLTYNVDNDDNEGTENEEDDLWKDAGGITPVVYDKDGNWHYNETTCTIQLKIPSIFEHMTSPDVYFYFKNDKGSHMSITNFAYEADEDKSFIENVKRIYGLNNSYSNESLFDNIEIKEGITDNGYKYAYFIDETGDFENLRVISYIFVQLDDNVICKLSYDLFNEDFEKFDAEVMINSITHTLAAGPWRDEFLIIYNDDADGDAVKKVNFIVPYVYIKNPFGVYCYEDSEKEGLNYRLDFWLDDEEELTVFINEGTEIDYPGNITEGYTKNGFKFSYYVEENKETYYFYGEDKSEEITKLAVNIAVKLDEKVFKMKYELAEKNFDLFDINAILSSVGF